MQFLGLALGECESQLLILRPLANRLVSLLRRSSSPTGISDPVNQLNDEQINDEQIQQLNQLRETLAQLPDPCAHVHKKSRTK
ncbi:hypothetical protein DID73_00385 [Candidatus Marinamargulisbacteria bacterium SCGC AG-343-K17]|nr:hypothetical protein DID73_00385 [Candidatus Marinamargulisbacteria bacterium SCGC AG-343-K17]